MKIEARFKKGDEIHFMSKDKPKCKKVLGVAFYTGDCEGLHFKKKASEGEVVVIYHLGAYDEVEETKVFASKEELKANVFGID